MKFFIPTVILSFALGFFCNEFLTNRNVEKINPIDPITLLAENSQAEKKEHHTLIINDVVNTNLNVQSKRN